MTSAMEVTSWAQLVDAVAGTSPQDREEHIIIKNDLIVDDRAFIRRKVTLLTDGNAVTIRRDPNYPNQFFYIDSNGCLILGKKDYPPETLILDGNDGYMVSGVNVGQALITLSSSNSELVMHDGTVLQNNNNNSTGMGGGVSMSSGGTCIFTMNGGVIRNNKAPVGGGVCINASLGAVCTFIMNGGLITGNTAAGVGNGGGVYMYGVGGTAKFIMNSGTISGNTAITGGGLFYEGSSQFVNNGGIISGNTAITGADVHHNVH